MGRNPGTRFKGQGFLRKQLEAPPSQLLCSRTAALLFSSAAALLIPQQFLPWGMPMATSWFVATQSLIVYGALYALFVLPRVSRHAFPYAEEPNMLLGWLLLAAVAYATGGAESAFSAMFIFAMLYAAYFWKPRRAIPHILFGSALFMAPLVYDPQAASSGFLAFSIVALAAFWFTSAAILVQRAAMRRSVITANALALTDPLTGAANLRTFELMAEELTTAENGRFALIMVDLDGLKSANTHFGHSGGDRLIQTVARLMAESSSVEDQVFRIGGDEFTVVLPGGDKELAGDWLDCFAEAVAKSNANRSSNLPELKVSAGVAVRPDDGNDLARLKEVADMRMYRRKADAYDANGCSNAAPVRPNARISTAPISAESGLQPIHEHHRVERQPKELVARWTWMGAGLLIAVSPLLPGFPVDRVWMAFAFGSLCALMSAWSLIWQRRLPRAGEQVNDGAIVVLLAATVAATGGEASPFVPLTIVAIAYLSYFTDDSHQTAWIVATLAAVAATIALTGGEASALMRSFTVGFGSAVLAFVLLTNGRRLAAVRERIEALAAVDSLTQVGNRRAFEKALDWLTAVDAPKDGRAAYPFVVSIDIDDFKEVNTQFGHAGGDKLLQLAAASLRDAAGDDGAVFRVGGDEFMVLPTSSGVDGRRLAERCRRQIGYASRLLNESSNHALKVGASIGLAEWRPGMNIEALLAAVDEALMRSKAIGKNTVSHAEDGKSVRCRNVKILGLPVGL